MITYKYLGGWNEACSFFTVGNTYEIDSKDKKGNITLKDDSFDEYGSGFTMDKEEANKYFEEVSK